MNRPLGLALAGGGAHGAWQAGCLEGLTRAGLVFDKVLGFSAGALSGAGYFLGLLPELHRSWREVDQRRIMRLSPRFRPLSLYSDVPLWEAVQSAADEDLARRRALCDFTVVSLCVNDGRYDYARFTPGGAGGWDGPLAHKLVASCAIPTVFPPVTVGENGSRRVLIDGCVPGDEPIRFDALKDCADVLFVQMVRTEEPPPSSWLPWRRSDENGRRVVARQMQTGLDSLLALPKAPRVYRLNPSPPLEFSMLAFESRHCVPAWERGRSEAELFLADPESRRVVPASGL